MRSFLALIIFIVGVGSVFWIYPDPINWLSNAGGNLLAGIRSFWAGLSGSDQQLAVVALGAPPALAAVIGLWRMFFPARTRETRQVVIREGKPEFPFHIYSTERISELKKSRGEKHDDFPYQERFSAGLQGKFLAEINTPLLMMTGRRGLGKTRECIEHIQRIAERKGEEVCILYPKGEFDRPKPDSIPDDFVPRTLILFIDEIETRLGTDALKSQTGDEQYRGFEDRLAATIEWMRARQGNRDWRVILTASDEPDSLEKINAGSGILSEFKTYQLRAIHKRVRYRFIKAVATYFGFEIDTEAVAAISRKSDGTPRGIMIPFSDLARKKQDRSHPIQLSDTVDYSFSYPADWTNEVYRTAIAPYPERASVFRALSILYRLRIPPQQKLAVHLATTLGPSGGVFARSGAKIQRAIRRDLLAWVFEFDDELVCPSAYLESGQVSRDDFTSFLKSLDYGLQRRSLSPKLLAGIPGLYSVAISLGLERETLSVLRRAVRKRRNRCAVLWLSISLIQESLGERDSAIISAEQAVRVDKRHVPALFQLAYLQGDTANPRASLATARQAAEVAPDNDFVWLNLGILQGRFGNHKESVESLKKACGLNPQSPRAWYSLAIAYERSGKQPQSIDAARHAVKLDPDDARGWQTLGIALDRAGKHKEALPALTKAKKLNPGDGAICLSLGRVYASLEERGQAVRHFRQAEKLSGDDAGLLTAISIAFGINGYAEDAVDAAQKALRIRPRDVNAMRSLARSVEQIPGREGESIELQKRLAEQIDTAAEWAGYSVALGKADRHEDAVNAAESALAKDPDNEDALRSLSINLSHLERPYADRIEVMARLAKIADSAGDWSRLGKAYNAIGVFDKAAEAHARAVELDPDNIEARRLFAVQTTRLPDRVEEGIQALNDLANETNESTDWYRLAATQGRSGQYQDAVDSAQKAVTNDPGNLEARRVLALNLANIPGKESSAAHHQEIVCEQGNQADDWYRLSVTLGRLSRTDEAILAAEKAIQIDPEHYRAGVSLAINLSKSPGRAHEGIPLLKEIAPRTGRAEDWIRLAAAHHGAGETDAAANASRKAVDIDPENESALRMLARNLEKLDRFGMETLEAYQKLAEVSDKPSDWERYSLILGKHNRNREAVNAASKALEKEPTRVLARRVYVSNLDRMEGEEAAALEAARELASLTAAAPDNYRLAKMLVKAGDDAGALKAIAAARSTKPGKLEFRRFEISVLVRIPQETEKGLSLARGLAEETGTPGDWKRLAKACEHLQRHEEAANARQKALEAEAETAG
ncbi:tetratricopeptide repeat protein [Hyphobacterium marinum]|uniref:Tetratricopeptide repeat protein n=1 Tax=Hyphobacterium marinum TaxID=3116574 RepID=A0ABU7LUL5_9PROT|nr:tetratricopeptide repeat protein [Hyphobacterium sp. Y6023]MEE2565242.1 tetratricopeptide repeat protein [Hyphobacterium sp. Y6023]